MAAIGWPVAARYDMSLGQMKFDKFEYEQVDRQFVSRILNENSLRLSRTRQGISDTSTSASKAPLRAAGDDLKRRSAENEQRAHRLIFETRIDPTPGSVDAVKVVLFQIADLTNEGLLSNGRFRTWPIGEQLIPLEDGGVTVAKPKIPPDGLVEAVCAFCTRVFENWHLLKTDPVKLAAWSEWELNGGSLHPFYDGCGRISRSFGAALLIRGSCLLPLYDGTSSYFKAGNSGEEAFCDYMRKSIKACAKSLQ